MTAGNLLGQGGLASMIPPLPLWPLVLSARAMPSSLLSEGAAKLLNTLLADRADDLVPLEGKRLGIDATDTGHQLRFIVRGRRLLRSGCADIDLRISGSLADLLRLGLRLEDPDTLFFGRHLTLEGDTATGLYVKNLLDALDMDWAEAGGQLLGPVTGPLLARAVRKSGMGELLHTLLERSLRTT